MALTLTRNAPGLTSRPAAPAPGRRVIHGTPASAGGFNPAELAAIQQPEPDMYSPEGYLEHSMQSEMGALDAQYKQKWDIIQKNVKNLGPAKAQQMLTALMTQGRNEGIALQAKWREKADLVSRITKLRDQGAMVDDLDTERMRWDIAAGSEMANKLFPKPVDPAIGYGKLDTLEGRLQGDLKSFSVKETGGAWWDPRSTKQEITYLDPQTGEEATATRVYNPDGSMSIVSGHNVINRFDSRTRALQLVRGQMNAYWGNDGPLTKDMKNLAARVPEGSNGLLIADHARAAIAVRHAERQGRKKPKKEPIYAQNEAGATLVSYDGGGTWQASE